MADDFSPGRQHRPRVIPVLLVKDGLLHKGVRFRDLKYVGDPLVAVKIFNDKCADELVLLDISATLASRPPDFELVRQVAEECFMPLAYGGGVASIEHVRRLLGLGVEKVVLCSAAVENPRLVTEAAAVAGSQSVVACIDVSRDWRGRYRVLTHAGRRRTALDPVRFAADMVSAGAGEIMVNAVHRDGTRVGYDMELTKRVTAAVSVPVIACGGAGNLSHMAAVVREAQASAASAGSLFVLQPPHRAVLITFPQEDELRVAFAAAPR